MDRKKIQSEQTQQRRPGIESIMKPRPRSVDNTYKGSGKLKSKVAIITGGDSGIGRAVAIAYAKEGANIVIAYLNEHSDARETKRMVEENGTKCDLMAGDLGEEWFCQEVIETTYTKYGKIDILINNASEQHPQKSIENITKEQLERTFRTNIFSYFFMTKAAVKYMKEGSCIINTTSVTAYKGSPELLDYSSTKGAEVSFTRSLAINLAKKNIRVNGVAPGPIWTPLIPSTFDEDKVAHFGEDVPLGRAGQPEEIVPSYVYLASDDSSYMTGQMLHPNGGTVING